MNRDPAGDFESRYVELPDGRMHYLDQGSGPAVVMVHGTPTSSFLYRKLIPPVAQTHRVIAVDHLGFGRSDKPAGADYRPAAHARRLEELVERLGLKNIVVVVHDFGGPIGLSYAIQHADNVRGLVLFNTWMWSLAGTPAERISRLFSGSIGRFLYTRLNFSPRVILKAAFADKRRLTKEAHRRYMDAFPTPAERVAPWILARELIGSTEWYDGLWQRRDRIAGKPALVLWGMKDPAFKPDDLARWRQVLTNARVVEFAAAGHFVQEEAPEEAAARMLEFLGTIPMST
jgi:pimeloyl-ACP methyl ester carboxylesterase